MQAIRGVIFDVGGTLWPETHPETDADQMERAARVAAALGIGRGTADELVRQLLSGAPAAPDWLTQDTIGYIRSTAAGGGLALSEGEALAVRRAMCLRALGRWQPFRNATELLATVRALGAGCALLSNATWRDAEDYQRDLVDLGLARFVDAVVTSVETGLRKPNPAIFSTAIWALGLDAGACVMIGNSEENDILPALALSMRTIRVAIEEPRPARSAAHAVTGSLHEAAEVLRSWAWADGAG
jgi:FMN phosphatase YigB (HAD superfamily)